MDLQARLREALALRDARTLPGSLRAFARAAWPIVQPGVALQWGWHCDAICDHLEAVTRGDVRDLVINIAPRHGKSTLVSVLWPAWVWTHAPAHQWLTSSAVGDLAVRDATAARRLIESPWYQERWPLRMAGDENLKTRYTNEHGGHRITTSTGAGRLGEGGDTLISDDPHRLVRGYVSDTDLDAATLWWDQVMSSRRNHPRHSSRVIIMQRVHESDLTAHCLERGYTHLCLPTEWEPDHPCAWPSDPRTDPGALLWPERFGPDQVESARRDLGSYGYNGQHQQRPAPPEGGMLQRDWWVRMPRSAFPAEYDEVICAWDLAFKGGELSDYTAGFAMGRVGARVYGLGAIHRRMDFTEQLRAVQALRSTWDAGLVLVEDAANAAALFSVLRDTVPGLVPVRARTSKEARAAAWSPGLEAGQMVLPEGEPWADDLIDECAAFPHGAHDDMVDAWGHGATRLSSDGLAFGVAVG